MGYRLVDANKYCEFLNTYPLEKAQNNFMSFYRKALQNIYEFEVKAIPIEWINNWLNTGRNAKYFIPMMKMVEEWEKENDKGSE